MSHFLTKISYRHTSLYHTSLYCAAQMAHFLQTESKTLCQQQDYDCFLVILYLGDLELNPQISEECQNSLSRDMNLAIGFIRIIWEAF